MESLTCKYCGFAADSISEYNEHMANCKEYRRARYDRVARIQEALARSADYDRRAIQRMTQSGEW